MKNLIPRKIVSSLFLIVSIGCGDTQSKQMDSKESSQQQNPAAIQDSTSNKKPEAIIPIVRPFDTLDYNNRLIALTNKDSSGKWPAKGAAYPLPGAMLPYNRIIAYYGNLYSK